MAQHAPRFLDLSHHHPLRLQASLCRCLPSLTLVHHAKSYASEVVRYCIFASKKYVFTVFNTLNTLSTRYLVF